jgi:opacity protein-like surface antigen
MKKTIILYILLFHNGASATIWSNERSQSFYIGANIGSNLANFQNTISSKNDHYCCSSNYKHGYCKRAIDFKYFDNIDFSKSFFYNLQVGYQVNYNAAIEISLKYSPINKISYKILHTESNPRIVYKIPNTEFVHQYDLNFSASSLLLNFIFTSNAFNNNIQPFILGGFGISHVNIEEKQVFFNDKPNIRVFTHKKVNSYCSTFQFGVGFSTEITENLSINIMTKIHFITGVPTNLLANSDSISFYGLKKNKIDIKQKVSTIELSDSIGFGEISLGFKYKLPF